MKPCKNDDVKGRTVNLPEGNLDLSKIMRIYDDWCKTEEEEPATVFCVHQGV